MRALFDQIEHYDSPARETESTFHFLNRAQGAMWGHVRATIQAWNETYPDVSGDLRSRFRQDTPRQHVAAWWELYVFTLFDRLGYQVQVHPDVGTRKRPDFLVAVGDDRAYVECMVLLEEECFRSDSQAWLFERINGVESADFMVDLTIEEVGTQRPRAKEIVQPIERWLDSLDWQTVSERMSNGGAAPEQTFQYRDWRIRLAAWPVRADRRGEPGRLIGTYLVGNAEPRRDEEQLRAALAKRVRDTAQLSPLCWRSLPGRASLMSETLRTLCSVVSGNRIPDLACIDADWLAARNKTSAAP